MEQSHITNYFSNMPFTLVLIGLMAAVFLFTLIRIRLSSNHKESPILKLQREFSMGKLDAYEFEQRKRQIQKEEDLKTRSFFLSRV